MPRRQAGRRPAPDERTIDRFRPHWTALTPSLLWAMALAVTVGAVLATAPLSPGSVLLGAVVIWLLLSSRTFGRWLRRRTVLTTHRLRVRRSGRRIELPVELITEVWYEQRLRDRLLRVGDVVVARADGEPAVRLTDVPDPAGVAEELLAARAARLSPPPNAGTPAPGPVDRTA
ncbi:MAG: PH domain-containing protein [Nitriliruptoraceae bacterium]